jgi:hypothetical protein
VRQFIAGNRQMLSHGGTAYDLQIEPSERAWEMVSLLKQRCRFPAELEMEVYSGVIGREAAVTFLSWCAEQRERPLSADEILNSWNDVAARAGRQRDDIQAASASELIAFLQNEDALELQQQDNLVAYINTLPRDMRFGLVKSLLRIPAIAAILSQDRYDEVILDTISRISEEVA